MQKWDALGDRCLPWGTEGELRPEWDQQWREADQAAADSQVYGIIFRVATLDEAIQGKRKPFFLHNMGHGTRIPIPWAVPARDYTFSAPDLDLAIVSLNHPGDLKRFGDELVERGYRPIMLHHIDDGPWDEGDEVFTVGFPSKLSVVWKEQQPWDEKWSSEDVSLPAFAFGRVSMLDHRLNYFWCDMSIAPGNSGGPVVKGGNLVGIISGQAFDAAEYETPAEGKSRDNQASWSYRIPFAKVIKGKFVRELVEKQIEKLERWDRERTEPEQAPPTPPEPNTGRS